MNPLLEQLFNTQNINGDYLQAAQRQYHYGQVIEIEKAVKAIHDYFDAARKIAPEYQDEALRRCVAAVAEEMWIERHCKSCGNTA